MLLPHLASRLYGTPLLVARSKLDIILAVLGDRIGWPEPQSALPAGEPDLHRQDQGQTVAAHLA